MIWALGLRVDHGITGLIGVNVVGTDFVGHGVPDGGVTGVAMVGHALSGGGMTGLAVAGHGVLGNGLTGVEVAGTDVAGHGDAELGTYKGCCETV